MKKKFSIFTTVYVSLIAVLATIFVFASKGGIRNVNASQMPVQTSQSNMGNGVISPYPGAPSSFADLASRLNPVVVNIRTSKRLKMSPMMPFPDFGQGDRPFGGFFRKFFNGMPRDEIMRSLGSGFIIDKNGTILTNNHVISQADDIEVGLADGRKFKGKVVGADPRTDIAVVRINAKGALPYAKLGDSNKMRSGDWVMAIGNPFGLEHTVTVGVVSAKGRLIDGAPYAKFIQTDASINPGNSGGPLVNMRGEVIGINSMIHAGAQGIGFAIPIDLAKKMLPDLISKGKVSRGWLGVSIQEITPDLAKTFKLKNGKGALVSEVYSGSPAAKAGLVRGDIVLKFNGNNIEQPYDLSMYVGQTPAGSTVKIVVLRNGKRKTLTAKILHRSESSPLFAKSGKRLTTKADVMGLIVRTITVEDAARLDVPATFHGVVVARVEPDASVAYADVRAGDVILEVNSAKIQSMADYNKAVSKLKKGDFVRLFIKRGRSSIYLAFRI